ncbi:MAG: hypothetical protein ABI822_13890 [Bryobacteraceae bacterium]
MLFYFGDSQSYLVGLRPYLAATPHIRRDENLAHLDCSLAPDRQLTADFNPKSRLGNVTNPGFYSGAETKA